MTDNKYKKINLNNKLSHYNRISILLKNIDKFDNCISNLHKFLIMILENFLIILVKLFEYK